MSTFLHDFKKVSENAYVTIVGQLPFPRARQAGNDEISSGYPGLGKIT